MTPRRTVDSNRCWDRTCIFDGGHRRGLGGEWGAHLLHTYPGYLGFPRGRGFSKMKDENFLTKP